VAIEDYVRRLFRIVVVFCRGRGAEKGVVRGVKEKLTLESEIVREAKEAPLQGWY